MSMNIFRLAGDLAHVLSIFVLLLRLRVTKNAVGISIKTQELYLIVFIARYLDLFTTFYSVYNSVMKLLYISTTSYIIYMVYYTEPFKATFDKAHDSFLHWKFAVLPCAVLGVMTNLIQGFSLLDVIEFFCFHFFLLFHHSSFLVFDLDVLGLLHLSRSGSHCTTVVPLTKISRGRKFNCSLCFPSGHLSRSLHCELGLSFLP
jgi:hypothetical protein